MDSHCQQCSVFIRHLQNGETEFISMHLWSNCADKHMKILIQSSKNRSPVSRRTIHPNRTNSNNIFYALHNNKNKKNILLLNLSLSYFFLKSTWLLSLSVYVTSTKLPFSLRPNIPQHKQNSPGQKGLDNICWSMYEIIQCNSKNKHSSKLARTVDINPPISTVRMGVVIVELRAKCDVAQFKSLWAMYVNTHIYIHKYMCIYSVVLKGQNIKYTKF